MDIGAKGGSDGRVFGVGTGVLALTASALAATGRWPFSAPDSVVALVLGAVGVLLVGLALAAPHLLVPVEAAWMQVMRPIAWVNSRVVLAVVYYGIVWPTGLVRRLGPDALCMSGRSASYWRARDPIDRCIESYRRQV